MFRRKDEDIAQDLLGDAEVNESGAEAVMTSSDSAESDQNTTASAGSVKPAGMASAPTAPYTRSTASDAPAAPAAPRASVPNATPTAPNAFRANTGGEYGRGRPASAGGNNDYRSTASAAATATATPSVASTPMRDSANKSGSRRVLTVGNDILLRGEIATCDRLVIEGAVDATLNEVHTVEIAESGSFKGTAEIEDAEISGIFEGELIVRNRLVIYSTGQVRGKITYGEIEIERGGELTGEIKTIAQHGGKAKTGHKSKHGEAVAA